MTDWNATDPREVHHRVQTRIPPETQARALLRLVPPVGPLEYGDVVLPGSDAHALMLARADAQSLADRVPFGDGAAYLHRARVVLRDLQRLASIDGAVFARECAAVDARERQAMHAAMQRVAPVQGPGRSPAPPPTVLNQRDIDRLQPPAIGPVKPDPGTEAVLTDSPGVDNLRQLTDYTRANAH